MNPLHWGAEFWGLVMIVSAIVGGREWLKRFGPVQRWLDWRDKR